MEGQQRIGALVELPQVLRELGEDPATRHRHCYPHAPRTRDFSRHLIRSGGERAVCATPDAESPITVGGQELPRAGQPSALRSYSPITRRFRNGHITDIALVLGYADPSGFTHAFQRWAGVAPSEWRSS